MSNRFFTLALSAALALGIPGVAIAQDNAPQTLQQDQSGTSGPGPMRMDPDRQLQRLTRELGLSADQQSQIKPVLVDREQKMEQLFQDQTVARPDRHAKMQALRQDTQSRIEAVLNDQQKQKFEAMQEHMRGGRGRSGGPQEGAPQPQ
jgi:protein CpxP